MIKIRKATISDVINIQKCNQTCLPMYYNILELAAMMFINVMNVACHDDKIVGFIICEKQKNNNIHILSFAIYENYRRRGIGSQLLESIASGFNTVTLYVHTINDSGINFYKKNGFKITETMNNYYGGFFKDSNDAYKMVKILT
jgi:ribosomal protein S18 acetylase RimI-like enzyme